MDKRTTQILLLRHGETDANAAGVLQGHLPVPLNLTGIRQATLLAARLQAHRPPIDVLITSDLSRATQTAAQIASACGLKVVVDAAWRERGFGLLEGKPVGNHDLWRAASGEMDPPGAEPISEMLDRVCNALLRLPIQNPHARVIAVMTHGGPIRGVLRMISEGRLPRTRGYTPSPTPAIANCAILHLLARRYRNGIRWRIISVNDSAHLGELISDRDAI